MRLTFLCVCVGLMLALAPGAIAASALASLAPYTVNQLNDDDLENAFLNGEESTLEVGDYLYGIFEIDKNNTTGVDLLTPGWPTTFTAAFAVEVLAKTEVPLGGGVSLYTWQFGPITAGASQWTSINSALPTPNSNQTMFVIYEDDGWDVTGTEAAGITSVQGTALWELGFSLDALGNVVPNQFWWAQTNGDDISMDGLFGSYLAGVNVTYDYMTSGVDLLFHKHNLQPQFTGETQVQFVGLLFQNSNEERPAWEVESQSDIYIKPTPEPGTLALLGLGLAACGAVVIRRRRKA